jgi:hypothetical protein
VFKFKALSLKYRTGRYGKRWIVHICAEAALIIPLIPLFLLAEWIKPLIFGQKSDNLPTRIFSVQNCALPKEAVFSRRSRTARPPFSCLQFTPNSRLGMGHKKIPQNVVRRCTRQAVEVRIVDGVTRCELTGIPIMDSVEKSVETNLGTASASGCILEK